MSASKAWFGPGYLGGIVPRPLNARAWTGTVFTVLLVLVLCLTGRYENRLIAGGLMAYYLGLIYAIAEEKPRSRTLASASVQDAAA